MGTATAGRAAASKMVTAGLDGGRYGDGRLGGDRYGNGGRVGRWQIEGGLDAEVWVRRGHRRGRNGVGGIGGGIEVEGRRVGGCGRGSGGRHAPSRIHLAVLPHTISLPCRLLIRKGRSMEGLGSTIGRTLAGYGGAPSPSSTTTHHIPPLPVPCLRPGPPPAEGKEYGGIRWYRGRVMAGSAVGYGKRRGQARRRRGGSVGGRRGRRRRGRGGGGVSGGGVVGLLPRLGEGRHMLVVVWA